MLVVWPTVYCDCALDGLVCVVHSEEPVMLRNCAIRQIVDGSTAPCVSKLLSGLLRRQSRALLNEVFLLWQITLIRTHSTYFVVGVSLTNSAREIVA
jgi:hypothetical protein